MKTRITVEIEIDNDQFVEQNKKLVQDVLTKNNIYCKMKNTKILSIKGIREVDRKDLGKFEKEIKKWGKDNKDDSLEIMYARDRIDLSLLVTALKDKNLQWARTIVGNMDTLLRDQIPSKIYESIYEG